MRFFVKSCFFGILYSTVTNTAPYDLVPFPLNISYGVHIHSRFTRSIGVHSQAFTSCVKLTKLTHESFVYINLLTYHKSFATVFDARFCTPVSSCNIFNLLNRISIVLPTEQNLASHSKASSSRARASCLLIIHVPAQVDHLDTSAKNLGN